MTLIKTKAASIVVMFAIAQLTAQASAVSTRQVEYLSRGGYAVKTDEGVYLSWRMFGTEAQNITFDIYRDNEIILSDYDGTNYSDSRGGTENRYRVVPHGSEGNHNDVIDPVNKPYIDIPLDKPEDGIMPDGEQYSYGVYDVSAADVDNDGAYVSEKGAPIGGKELTWTDEYTGETFVNESDMRNEQGRIIKGPDWKLFMETVIISFLYAMRIMMGKTKLCSVQL